MTGNINVNPRQKYQLNCQDFYFLLIYPLQPQEISATMSEILLQISLCFNEQFLLFFKSFFNFFVNKLFTHTIRANIKKELSGLQRIKPLYIFQ